MCKTFLIKKFFYTRSIFTYTYIDIYFLCVRREAITIIHKIYPSIRLRHA